jgi:hypothetical protein
MCKKGVVLAMAAFSLYNFVNADEDFEGANVIQLGLQVPIKFTGGGEAFEDLLVKKSGVADAKTVKDIFAKDEFKNRGVESLDSSGLKWGIGGNISYTYYFTELFGCELKVVPTYWLTSNKFVIKGKDGGGNGKNKDNEDLTFEVKGFSLELGFAPIFNLLEDGLKFEDGEQVGTRVEFEVPFGIDLNFFDIAIEGKEDAKKVWTDTKKLNKDCLSMLRLSCNPAIKCVFPFGLYLGGGPKINFLGEYKVEAPKDNGGQDQNKNKSADVKGSVDLSARALAGYDLSNFLN